MYFGQVAIIGADHISVSIGLALKAQKEATQIVGYDADKATANQARAMGAFDRVERNPGRACREAELVIVSVPLADMRETFAKIAPHLRPSCLVTDTARLKAPVLRWAEETLPENVFFTGGHPILHPAVAGLEPLEGLDAASETLLKNALYCFTAPSGTPDAVIDTFAAWARTLEAHPFFVDVIEHDGLQAGVEGLPDLLAIALLRTTVDTPGWHEMRKFGGYRFAIATEAADDAHKRHAEVFMNRENILLRLNILVNELMRLRDVLAQDDPEKLAQVFTTTVEGRDRWLVERAKGMWGQEGVASMDEVPSAGEQFGELFFGGLASRRRDRSDPSRQG
jgi:prephenate dehydrogenase